jgi:hypothetical protein
MKGRDLEDRDINGMIVKFITKKYGVRVWTGFIWLRIGTSSGFL